MKIDRNKIYGITTKEILEKNLDYKKFLTNEKSDFEDILYYEEIQEMFPNQHLVVEVINPDILEVMMVTECFITDVIKSLQR